MKPIFRAIALSIVVLGTGSTFALGDQKQETPSTSHDSKINGSSSMPIASSNHGFMSGLDAAGGIEIAEVDKDNNIINYSKKAVTNGKSEVTIEDDVQDDEFAYDDGNQVVRPQVKKCSSKKRRSTRRVIRRVPSSQSNIQRVHRSVGYDQEGQLVEYIYDEPVDLDNEDGSDAADPQVVLYNPQVAQKHQRKSIKDTIRKQVKKLVPKFQNTASQTAQQFQNKYADEAGQKGRVLELAMMNKLVEKMFPDKKDGKKKAPVNTNLHLHQQLWQDIISLPGYFIGKIVKPVYFSSTWVLSKVIYLAVVLYVIECCSPGAGAYILERFIGSGFNLLSSFIRGMWYQGALPVAQTFTIENAGQVVDATLETFRDRLAAANVSQAIIEQVTSFNATHVIPVAQKTIEIVKEKGIEEAAEAFRSSDFIGRASPYVNRFFAWSWSQIAR